MKLHVWTKLELYTKTKCMKLKPCMDSVITIIMMVNALYILSLCNIVSVHAL